MSTVTRLGPGDHGRELSFDEYMAGDYEEGWHYELIDGSLYVTPAPNYSHDWLEKLIFRSLQEYSSKHPDIIGHVTDKARVFVPGARRTTAPEPDIVAYRRVPPGRRVDWREISPFIVAEILGHGSEDKDLERNVDLYLRVPSIEEYWVFDIREDPDQPLMRAHRRRGAGWEVIDLAADKSYTTPLLPGFSLRVDPSRDIPGA